MKFQRSIRVKLTLYYSLIVGATLFAFAAASYYYTEQNLLSSLDRSLYNEVVWLKNFVEPQARQVKQKKYKIRPKRQASNEKKSPTQPIRKSDEVEMRKDSVDIEFDAIWNQIYEHTLLTPKKQIIQIRDRNNDILYKSGLGKEDLVFDDIPYNITKLVTIWNSNGQPLRLAVSQDQSMKVYVAYPISEINDVLSNLFSIFIYFIPVALIVSVFGGYFLAVRSFQPVDDITRTARAITAQNLDRRIHYAGVDDELGRLVATFNEMISRLQLSFSQIQQFSIDASHELRTPLTIMRGELELVLRSKKRTPEEYRQVLSSTLEETIRMTSIVENLLVLTKADLGRSQTNFQDVWLRQIIEELHEDSEILAQSKKITVAMGTLDDALVFGDPVRIRQLLLNLIDNAIKYTPEEGSVELSLTRDDGQAKIKVKDTGVGIPAEEQLKIFDRFYRVDKARSRELGGSGLGLSISKWIAELHGGSISVESESEKGSVFTVSFPLKHSNPIQGVSVSGKA
ncbi:MAG: ATP-binding protein [Bacteroidota bacterium]|nr:ATP-binding protein [Bacteroidota bacterium]